MNSLANLLGRSIHSVEVQAFLQSQLGFSPKSSLPTSLQDQFDSPYLASASAGIVVWHTELGHVIGMALTVRAQDGFSGYSGLLDRGLSTNATLVQIDAAFRDLSNNSSHADEREFSKDPYHIRFKFVGSELDFVVLRLAQPFIARAQQLQQQVESAEQAERDHPFIPYITLTLLALSLACTALSQFGQAEQWLASWQIASASGLGLSEVFAGEFWRLFTPMFLHFNLMHLVFNMLWLWDLGGLLERKHGAKYFLLLVAVISLLANIAEYGLTASPYFGGMSGVVYGLFGYLWVQDQYPKQSKANGNNDVLVSTKHLSNQTIWMMMIWFALCWLGVLGAIANWAHTAGLLAGAGLAYYSAKSKS